MPDTKPLTFEDVCLDYIATVYANATPAEREDARETFYCGAAMFILYAYDREETFHSMSKEVEAEVHRIRSRNRDNRAARHDRAR